MTNFTAVTNKMKKIIFGSLALLCLASGLSFFLPKYSQPPHRISAEVLGAQVGHFVIPPSSTPVPTPTPKEETTEEKYAKTSYCLVVYGDSMVDTMGERLEYLEGALKKLYPGINFNLYNFGKGSQNVEMGLDRWDQSFNYQDRHYPALTEIRPDIIILGSFSYNPFSPYDRERHWLGLSKLIEKAKELTPHVYLLAEISPLRENFGRGPNGVNWDQQAAFVHSGNILEQLENVVGLSKSLNVPLIDAFTKSGGNSSYSKKSSAYVNPSDGIHPSVLGHEFTASLIAQTIKLW